MDDGVKQRIIGAFVLLALGVIFVPIFFDRERMTPVDRTTQIPLAPAFEEALLAEEETKAIEVMPESEQEVVETTEPTPKPLPTMPPDKSVPANEMFTPDQNKLVSLSPEKPKLGPDGVPVSWVIQVASFRFEGHAKQMRDKLIEDGYRSYVRDVKTSKGKMTRVYIGPKLDKSRLLEIKKEYEAKHKVSTILLKFEP